MRKNFLILFLIVFFPIKVFALIEVDITRGNLNPLPLAVSPLSIDNKSKKNFEKIIKSYDYVVDGTDNFTAKFLINDLSLKYKKFLVTGVISKFDGHIFTFNFKNKKDPCLRCFYQEESISDDILNCEYEGILGTVAGIIGTMQANEILKKVLNIGQNLERSILIIDLLNLNFRKVKINKRKKCECG